MRYPSGNERFLKKRKASSLKKNAKFIHSRGTYVKESNVYDITVIK